MIRSSSLCSSTLEDSYKVYFAFFGVVFHFLWIFEFSKIFWKYKWNRKKSLHSVGPASAHSPGTTGPTARPFQPGQPRRWRGAHARMCAVTALGATAEVPLVRLAGDVLCDRVLPAMNEQLHRDGQPRWGGQTLTEAMWHRRGQESRVSGSIQQRRQRSDGRWQWCKFGRQHESREAGSLYPSALQLARALRLEFVGRATWPVPDQEGVWCASASFLYKQTHINVSPSHSRPSGWLLHRL
jgi:hypothetical protein